MTKNLVRRSFVSALGLAALALAACDKGQDTEAAETVAVGQAEGKTASVTELLDEAESVEEEAVSAARSLEYESLLFDDTALHTIDIRMPSEQWESFCETASDKEYFEADVVIDGETVSNVGVRTKGNSTLDTGIKGGKHRFSFVIEFDHYQKGRSYHGLDKICLNNMVLDSSHMKDFVSYHAFAEMGVPAPLSSYCWLSVNDNEQLGVFLIVEGVEDAFLYRVFNSSDDFIKRYKPDSTGNRRTKEDEEQTTQTRGAGANSDDVYLRYIDDDPESYPILFGTGAKSKLNDEDKTRMIESLRKLGACEDLDEVLDIEEVLGYWVVQSYLNNTDTMVGNTTSHNYWVLEEDGMLRMVSWDNDSTFGGLDGDAKGYINLPIDTPVQPSGMGFFGMGSKVDTSTDEWKTQLPILGWIWSDDSYVERYHELWQTMIDTVNMDAIIDKAYGVIEDYVDLDPTTSSSLETVRSYAERLKLYCKLRNESIQGQLDGTIPTTAAGQEADSSTLIDTSELSSGMSFSRRQ